MEAERLPAQVPRRRVLFENEDTDVPDLIPAIMNEYFGKIIVYVADKSRVHPENGRAVLRIWENRN